MAEAPPLAETVRTVQECAAAYLKSGGLAPVSEETDAWPRDASLRRMLHRLGILRGAQPSLANRRRMAAVHKALHDREHAGADAPGSPLPAQAFFERLRPYCESGRETALCLDPPICARCDLKAVCEHYGVAADKTPGIKDLPLTQRPRERLLQCGDAALSEAELLAIIIRDGVPGRSALDLAKKLLTEYGDLAGLARATAPELSNSGRFPGIGPAKAAQIRAAMALAVRYQSKGMRPGDQYTDSRQVFAHYHAQLSAKEEEVFICMMLDTKHRLIAEKETFRGSRNRSLAEPATIFKEALRHAATALILVHNHPSGDPTPSRDDEELTRRLRDAGELVGVRVLDHVIIGADQYFSFADMGKL